MWGESEGELMFGQLVGIVQPNPEHLLEIAKLLRRNRLMRDSRNHEEESLSVDM